MVRTANNMAENGLGKGHEGQASMSLLEDAATLQDDLVKLRRELHQVPEIGLDLPRTQDMVLAAIDGLPLEVSTGKEVSSVTAVLRGGKPGPVVLLRGDMDALPVAERTGLPFTSRHEGAMHACGHDLHTAGLVGAARLLAARKEDLAGDVVFMFQPGEEGHDGAGHMIREGVLEAAGRPLAAAYGLHVFSSMFPAGVFASRPGPLMAASDGLLVRVVGSGGHGSAPHRALDPVPAACEMVTALQTLVTRQFDVFDPVVITVGSFHAGTKRNVIPDEATFEATVRTFSETAHARVREAATRVCRDIASAHGLRVEVDYVDEYPVTVNHAAEHDFVADTVREAFGVERFHEMVNPLTGSEDFSRILQEVPGAYVFLGATPGDDPESAPNNHSPLAVFDDRVLGDAAALLAELATRRLTRTA
jgi:amidohydrolase